MYKPRKIDVMDFSSKSTIKSKKAKELFGTITRVHPDYKEKFNQNYDDLIGQDFVAFENSDEYKSLEKGIILGWIRLNNCELLDGRKVNVTCEIKRSDNFVEYYI